MHRSICAQEYVCSSMCFGTGVCVCAQKCVCAKECVFVHRTVCVCAGVCVCTGVYVCVYTAVCFKMCTKVNSITLQFYYLNLRCKILVGRRHINSLSYFFSGIRCISWFNAGSRIIENNFRVFFSYF